MLNLLSIELIQPKGVPQTQANPDTLNTILSDVFLLLGAIAFLMIVISGLRYIMARGNADSTAQARNTIIYSAIGLIISALAYSIVTFIIKQAS